MKRIVILGAGFGGLRAATLIAKKIKHLRLMNRYEVLLIDRNEHQTYTPLLYEVATTSKTAANIHELHSIATYNIRSILKNTGAKFIQSEVDLVDIVGGDVHLASGEQICADYLVIALGSESNYFDIPGLKEHALPLKTIKDSIAIRDAVWNFAMDKRSEIRVLIGGGGPSGVELAGELKVWSGELLKEFSSNLDVMIIEAGSTVMPGFPGRIVGLVHNRLAKLGVKLFEHQRIASAEAGRVKLQNGRSISYDILIWTGGVKAPSLLARTEIKTESRGRAEVGQGLECLPQTPDLKLHAKIYGLGDSVCFYDPETKEPIPGVARAALSQAVVVAHNIIEDVKHEQGLGAPKHDIYRPRNYPYITPVGGKYAIAKLGPIVIAGFFGWILKGLVELNYLLSILPLGKALVIWVTGLYIFIQNDRLG